jgi:plasmid stabilization system protein ParE
MSVGWTKRALKQLWAAYDWIEKENPAAAYEFLEAVTALVDLLDKYPGMGVKTRQPGVSMLTLVRYRYLIFYKVVRRDEVRIIRIWHASRKRPN